MKISAFGAKIQPHQPPSRAIFDFVIIFRPVRALSRVLISRESVNATAYGISYNTATSTTSPPQRLASQRAKSKQQATAYQILDLRLLAYDHSARQQEHLGSTVSPMCQEL